MNNTLSWRWRLLLAVAALCGTAQVCAQPREPPPKWDETATPTPAMDAWLGRLVGRFRFEGVISVVSKADCPELCESIKGTGDCVAVGTGPGVQCILNVNWQDIYEEDHEEGAVYNLPGGVSYLDPAMALFGIDSGKSAINYLLVDNKGLPEGGLGAISGDRATFRTPCVNSPVLFNAMKPQPTSPYRTCNRIVRIDAKPDANLLFMMIDIEVNDDPFTRLTLSLRRIAQDEDGAISTRLSGLR